MQYVFSPLSHVYHRDPSRYPMQQKQKQPIIIETHNTINPRVVVVDLYLLQTTSFLRKYIAFIDIIISWILSCVVSRRRVICCIGGGPLVGWKALAAHHSQFVWFRKLFIIFSSYLYVNTLKKVRLLT